MADESGVGGEDGDYFAMAGFVGDHTEWAKFNVDWSAALKRHGIPEFHMKDFAGFRGPYVGWSEDQRQALMSDLLDAICARDLRAYGACMQIEDLKRYTPELKEGFVAPYFACFQEFFGAMRLETDLCGPEGILLIYSLQEEYETDIKLLWAYAKTFLDYARYFRGEPLFQDMRKTLGLQAADLLVWELRHRFHLQATKPHLKIRYPLKRILERQNMQKFYSLKFIPKWYMSFQAAGLAPAAMDVILADLNTWGFMYQDLEPSDDDIVADIRRRLVLDKYAPPVALYEKTHIKGGGMTPPDPRVKRVLDIRNQTNPSSSRKKANAKGTS